MPRKTRDESLNDKPRDELPQDLQLALDRVGPAQYGLATARKFAPGGEYSDERKKRRRTALM